MDFNQEVKQAIDDLREDLILDYEVIRKNSNDNNLSNLLKKSQKLDKLIFKYYNCME